MQRDRLVSAIRKWCRKNGVAFALDIEGGKGSHYKVTVGGRWTIIQSGDLGPRHIDTILDQLRIPRHAIKR